MELNIDKLESCATCHKYDGRYLSKNNLLLKKFLCALLNVQRICIINEIDFLTTIAMLTVI